MWVVKLPPNAVKLSVAKAIRVVIFLRKFY
jgi:hypothetical protein